VRAIKAQLAHDVDAEAGTSMRRQHGAKPAVFHHLEVSALPTTPRPHLPARLMVCSSGTEAFPSPASAPASQVIVVATLCRVKVESATRDSMPPARKAATMELESSVDFLAPDDMRLKGTRIGIETIVYDSLHRGQSPAAMAACYRSRTLEQVSGTITSSLHNREAIHASLAEWLAHGRRRRAAQEQHPRPPVVARLRTLATPRQHAEAQTT